MATGEKLEFTSHKTDAIWENEKDPTKFCVRVAVIRPLVLVESFNVHCACIN